MKNRTYCYTVNNIAPELAKSFVKLGCARYTIWQLEVASTGTMHLQGYVEFTKPHRVAAVKTWLNCAHAHVEARKGSREQARDYCRKSESRLDGPWELGDWESGGAGRRTDSMNAVESLRKGGLKRLLEDDASYVLKHPKQCKEFLAIDGSMTQSLRSMLVIWITGPSGVGKSWHAYHWGLRLGVTTYSLSMINKDIWFDGYQGEDILLIDELNQGMIAEPTMLRLLDVYPLQVPIKGSMAKANWQMVIITSNFDPSHMYSDVGGRLARRIHYHVQADNREILTIKMDALFGFLQQKPECPKSPIPENSSGTRDEVVGNTIATDLVPLDENDFSTASLSSSPENPNLLCGHI